VFVIFLFISRLSFFLAFVLFVLSFCFIPLANSFIDWTMCGFSSSSICFVSFCELVKACILAWLVTSFPNPVITCFSSLICRSISASFALIGRYFSSVSSADLGGSVEINGWMSFTSISLCKSLDAKSRMSSACRSPFSTTWNGLSERVFLASVEKFRCKSNTLNFCCFVRRRKSAGREPVPDSVNSLPFNTPNRIFRLSGGQAFMFNNGVRFSFISFRVFSNLCCRLDLGVIEFASFSIVCLSNSVIIFSVLQALSKSASKKT